MAIEGIDTRALVRHIRDHGAQRAVVSTTDADVASLLEKVRRSPSLVGVNLAADVSCDGAYSYTAANLPASHGFALAAPAEPRFKVVVYHCGVKRSILDGLVATWLRAHRRALGHAGRRRARHEPRRRVPLQRPGRPGGGGGDLPPGGEAAGEGAAVRHLPGPPDDGQGRGRGNRQAEVRPSRRQPPGAEPADRPRGGDGPEPRLLPALPEPGRAGARALRRCDRARGRPARMGPAAVSPPSWPTSASGASGSPT